MHTIHITCPARLDASLAQTFPTLRGGRVHKYLRENKIKVNGKKLPLNTQLQCGDTVCVYLSDEALGLCAAAGPLFLQARRGLRVAYEDDIVLIAEKPAGVLVADETGNIADTFLNRVLLHCYEAETWKPGDAFAPHLCHRLDTGTSGLVLLAKTAEAEAFLCVLIKERQVQKEYLCVTLGAPQPAAATLRGYLQKDAARGIVTVLDSPAPGAKEIVTRYETLITNDSLALLSVELITGRTHQIRAHLAHIGYPILGDSKYGSNTANRAYKLKYQALCAYRLTFPVLRDTPCDALSEKMVSAEKPWYVIQMENGTLR